MAFRFPLVILAVLAAAPLAAASPEEDAEWWLGPLDLAVTVPVSWSYEQGHEEEPAAQPEEPAEAPAEEEAPAPSQEQRGGLLAPIAPVVQEVAPVVDPVLDAAPVDFDVDWLLNPRTPAEAPAPSMVAPAPAPEPVEVQTLAQAAAEPAALAPALLVAGLAATGAAPAASLGWDRLRRFGILAVLYARIARERLLDHGARERLLAVVRERPGLPLSDLARAADIPRNTAVYHLRRLEKENLLSSVRQGRVRLYFAPGSLERRENADALAALRHPTTRAVATQVGSAPGLDQRALCEATGLTPSLAHWHATRLEDAGVLQRQREGRHVRYYPGPAMRLLDA